VSTPIDLRELYILALAGSVLTVVPLGYWVSSMRNVRGRRAFLLLLAVDAGLAGLGAVALVVPSSPVDVPLAYVRGLFALASVIAWFAFATVYTDRSTSLRSPGFGGAVALAGAFTVALVTNPVHGLYWSTVARRSVPFEYVATVKGPLGLAANLWAYAAIAVGLYYLGELFVTSRHRSSLSVAVLVAASAGAGLPNAVAIAGLTPVPAYDHTALGVAPFVVGVAVAVFRLGMFDLRPVARDELIDRIDDPFLAVDAEGRIVDHNAAAGRTLGAGTDGEAGVGDRFADLPAPLTEAVSFPEAGGRQQVRATVETDEGWRDFSVSVSAVGDDDPVGYSVVLRDITTVEEYRRELERQNEQLEQFGTTVAHDLRNPLQIAMGHADELDRLLADVDESAVGGDPDRSLRAVTSSLDRMEEIVTDLQTLARKGKSVEKTTAVPLSAAVAEAWGFVDTDAASVTVARGGTIQADRGRLLSILENLFRNSVDHCPGPVSLTVRLREDGFTVADDGPGIPERNREQVFEYGVTTADDGTGLGLAIVRTMAESHGWSVRVDPDYADGTRFVFEGAVADPDPAAEADGAGGTPTTAPDGAAASGSEPGPGTDLSADSHGR
jgi:signal transduction histidine kinase